MLHNLALLLLFAVRTESFRPSCSFHGFGDPRCHPQSYQSGGWGPGGSTAVDRKILAKQPIKAQATTLLEDLVENFNNKLEPVLKEVTRTCKVQVAPVPDNRRLGLVAKQSISKNDVVLSVPYDDRFEISSNTASDLFRGILPEEFDSWTGSAGLIALQILNEVALASGNGGIEMNKRPDAIQDFMKVWVASLPNQDEVNHPLFWSEQDQEVLQSSSSTKIYRLLDDLEDDVAWLTENIFDKDRTRFPATCQWNGKEIPCFSVDGFRWAMVLSQSRSFFLNGRLRLLPILDMCNHSDEADEVRDGTMGTFGTTKGALLVASRDYNEGEEVVCSYGPKSAADYLMEHGFVPEQCWQTAVSELTFELDPEDRFYDDKLDILEFETYDQAPMDSTQSFDVVSAPGREGAPDPAMIQFVRLMKLGSTDAFLLESIFRKEVWGFMELPVSEQNELAVVNTITETCQRHLDEFMECPKGGLEVCTKLRELETKALTRTIVYLQREKEALDLKEYYQERRLKDLGLDSAWTPEDEMVDPDLNYGQTRAPGGADYDW